MLKGSVAMLFGISTPNHFAHRCKRYKIRRTLQLETEVLEEAWKTGAGWLESVSGFGSMLAIIISWSVKHSSRWMILHGILSGLYVI